MKMDRSTVAYADQGQNCGLMGKYNNIAMADEAAFETSMSLTSDPSEQLVWRIFSV
jgi:hypothetical protein